MSEKEPYHLKNWEYLRDLLCSSPVQFDAMVSEASEESKVVLDEDNDPHILLEDCGCVISRDGFESCLNRNREDLSLKFRDYPESPNFDRFLKALDEKAEEDRKYSAEKHSI